jgi:hypothetical protein
MSGKFSRVVGLVLVLGLMMTGVAFLVFLFDDVAREGAFELVLAGVAALMGLGWLLLRGPVGKALAGMLEGNSPGEESLVAARVADLEDRLAELSLETQRFLEIEERLEFTERLLAQHTDPARRVGDAS